MTAAVPKQPLIAEEGAMGKECDELVVNGVEYVKRERRNVSKNYVIVRTTSAGVHAGGLITRKGKEVTLKNARRLWYWDGAASLSQIAVDGVSKPQNCKFPCAVPEITLTEAIEIIPCTRKAIDSIEGVKVWEA